MATTNFAALTNEQKTVWSRDFWRQARNNSFIMQFSGQGPNALVQTISELTKNEKGARAVLTLIAELEGDGAVGDYALENNEEAIKAYDTVVRIDQMRNANRLAGRMADQKSIVNFRETSRDVLSYWYADRIDQLAFLTLSGISYTKRPNGATRPVAATGLNLSDLEFAADVTAPSAARHLVAKADGTVGTGALLANGNIGYKTIVNLKAFAKDSFVRGVKGTGGEEMYHMFVTPTIMAQLKLDTDFLANVRNAGARGTGNVLFQGSDSVMVDGVMIHEFRHVYHTDSAAADGKFGADGTVNGTRVLFCGAQALGMADLGNAEWVEDIFDYGNQAGISCSKILGFLKPTFRPVFGSTADNTVREDFGVIAMDVAHA
jgi:N4-gp56 family major capsid protein